MSNNIKSVLIRHAMFLVIALSLSCSDKNMSNGKMIEISNIDTIQIEGVKLNEEPLVLKIDITPNYFLYTMYDGDCFLKVVDRRTKQIVGRFCLKGNGPNEFIAFDIVNQNTKDKIIIQDYAKNTIYEFDLENSIKDGRTTISNSYVLPDRSAETFLCFLDAKGGLLIKELNSAEAMLGYYSDRSKQFTGLYKERITINHLNEMMTLADGYDPASNKIVSLSGNNQIDIICIDNAANNISLRANGGRSWSLEDFKEQDEQEESFYASIPRFNPSYIVALYSNKGKSEYHITNWSGDFLKRIEIDEQIRDFNVDWPNKKIYGITTDDYVFEYDICRVI